MENIQTIILDIMDNHPYEYIYAKQYDSGRVIHFYIKDNGKYFDISGITAYFQLKISDNEYVQTACNNYNNEYFYITLLNSATINSGSFNFQLELRQGNSIFKTIDGKMRVEKTVVSTDDIISEKYPDIVVLLDENGKIPSGQIDIITHEQIDKLFLD